MIFNEHKERLQCQYINIGNAVQTIHVNNSSQPSIVLWFMKMIKI